MRQVGRNDRQAQQLDPADEQDHHDHGGESLRRQARVDDLATTSNINPSEEMTTTTQGERVIRSSGT